MGRSLRVLATFVAVLSIALLGTEPIFSAAEGGRRPPALRARSGAVRCAEAPDQSYSMFVPLAHARYFGDVDLMLNNRGIVDHQVVPTWYVDGRGAVVGASFTLTEGQMHFASITELLPTGVRLNQVTGLELSYLGKEREVWSQALLTPVGNAQPRQTIDDPFAMIDDYKSSKLVAVWSVESHDSRAVIALANTSAEPLNVDIKGDVGSRRIHLDPYSGTSVIAAAADHGSSQGVELTSDGKPSALRASGFVIDRSDDVPHLVRFADPGGGASANLFATGLPVSGASGRLALRNNTNTPLTVSADFLDPDTGATLVSSKPLTLAGNGSSSLSLALLSQIPPAVTSVSVRINNDGGLPGSLAGNLYATDRAGGMSYEMPLRDMGPLRRSTGGYPWRIDGDYQTRMSITNVGQGPAFIAARLHYLSLTQFRGRFNYAA